MTTPHFKRIDLLNYATLAESAAALGISLSTLQRLIKKGVLRVHRVMGRALIHRKDIEQLTK